MESPRITSPKAFSPTPSVAASTRIPSPSIQSVAPSCVDQLDDLLMPLHIGSPPQTRIFDTHPAIAQLLHAHGFTALPTPPSVPAAPSFSAVPTPFGVATKSVTHTTGTNENGQHFTQQHYTVNTQEWYTPMYGRIMQQQPQLMSPPSTVAPSASPPQQQNEFSNGNGSGGGAARVWRPEITPNTEMSRFQTSTHQVPYKVSLEHNNSSVPPKGFNSAALPFNTDPRVKHLQYNSPMNLYSNASAAEQYAQQTAGIVSQEGSAERARSDQPAYLRSETLKMVKEQENGTSSLSSHPNPHGLPACYVCTRPILGVMAQAAGHTLHGDCLSCSTCGSSLKNIGHHFIDGKFYCDIHARLKRSTSTGPSDPNLMARIPPTAAQPMRPSEPPRATYQPDTLTRRPLSVSPNPAQWTSQTNTTNITVSNPKTQGVISPANRGVPSSQMYGADLGRSTSRATAPPVGDYRPFAQTAAAPPPPPSNPPPDYSLSVSSTSRIPSSIRSAVSPRRRARLPREWPPPKGVPTTPFWNTELHRPVPNTSRPPTISLADAVLEMDVHPEPEEQKRRPFPRRLTILERSPSGTMLRAAPRRVTSRPASVQFEPTTLPSTVSMIVHEPEVAIRHEPIIAKTKEAITPPAPLHPPPFNDEYPLACSTPMPLINNQASTNLGGSLLLTVGTKQERSCQEPAKPMFRTDAIASPPAKDASESSEPSSHGGEPVTHAAEETTPNESQKAGKKLQKKPGRNDPRRLTAIFNPNLGSEESTTNAEESEPRKPVFPDNTERPESPPRDYPLTPPAKPKRSENLKIGPLNPVADIPQPHEQAHSVVVGINLAARPFRTPDALSFPSHQKRYSHQAPMRSTPPGRPCDLGTLPPLMKGKQVVGTRNTPSPQTVLPVMRKRTPSPSATNGIKRRSLSPQRIIEAATKMIRRTTSPILNISVQRAPQNVPQSNMQRRTPSPQIVPRMGASVQRRNASPTTVRLSRVANPCVGRSPSPAGLRRIDLSDSRREDWTKASEIVDESDIMTDTSRRSDESTIAAASEFSDNSATNRVQLQDRLAVNSYDIDESELVNIRRRQKREDDTDIDSEEEKERWMREELELARKEELAAQQLPLAESGCRATVQQNPQHLPQAAETWDEPSERDTMSLVSESDEWRQKAMALLDDECQFNRDMALVSKLNQQLNECRQMDEADRQRAIDCMRRHQRTLEHKHDTRLARLLDSAIHYVAHMEDGSLLNSSKALPHCPPADELSEDCGWMSVGELRSSVALYPSTSKNEESGIFVDENVGPRVDHIPHPPERRHFGNVVVHPSNPVVKKIRDREEREILAELGSMHVVQSTIPDTTPQPPARRPLIPEADYPCETPAPMANALHGLETEQLSHVLQELDHIMRPLSADYIVRHLERVQCSGENQATSYSTTSRQTNQQQRSETHTLNQQVPGGKVPFCEACKQQIRGAFVLAQGMSWCPEHFICANASCARRLLECGFVEENGQKFCESCFESNIAPRCAKCTKPIISDCLNALQKKWHPACFTCAHCSKAFGNSAFYLEQGLPYCENDWNRLFTTKCYQCTYPIEAGDRWVEALGHAYHSNCFNCTRCNVNLEGESFYAKNGDPFCKLHA